MDSLGMENLTFDLLHSLSPAPVSEAFLISVHPFLSLLANRHALGVALSLIYSVLHNPRDGLCWGMFFSCDFHLK